MTSIHGNSVCLSSGDGGLGRKTGLYAVAALRRVRNETGKRVRREAQKQGYDHTPFSAKDIAPRTDGIMNAITATQSVEQMLADGLAIRRLTPLECERLQGFPDGWTEGYSDNARYKALGNAVTVAMVKLIMERLFATEKRFCGGGFDRG